MTKLDRTKLLGFKLDSRANDGAKMGTKDGLKMGDKTGAKTGIKMGNKPDAPTRKG
ncbi:hypothetical protein KUV47_11930 [Vannielia litorea]|uniref:hypothetical protein n=1 Tax=Vannielia litorea TaxID=1217970 RepID=UPI001C96CFDB|nr:hypothetical protein [Vannielia litorea]MBY6153924.1 hypothetical protein [Vannielia litorea]